MSPEATSPPSPDDTAPVPDVEIHESRLAPHLEAYRAPENHVFRNKFRQLTAEEQTLLEELKARAYFLHQQVELVPGGRYQAMAKTALEEAVMWAVKAVTA